MTDPQFEALLAVILEGVPDDPGLHVLRDYCVEELRRLAPVIDDMVEQAQTRGKLEGYLELIAMQRKRRVEVAEGAPL